VSRLHVVAVPVLVTALAQCAAPHVTEAGFWFDDVTFQLSPRETARLSGPISTVEKTQIEALARSELQAAFAGLRIAFSEDRRAFYKVRVRQSLPEAGRAGESFAIVPLGGQGAVSFLTVARWAMHYAPAGADRSTIIAGIGRGIGRVSAHEFAHEILVGFNFHGTRDPSSYEYGTPDRPAQYYGPIHWDTAWPLLARKLGKAE
jgi:hypothetical protein